MDTRILEFIGDLLAGEVPLAGLVGEGSNISADEIGGRGAPGKSFSISDIAELVVGEEDLHRAGQVTS